jgi:hypothetical protein
MARPTPVTITGVQLCDYNTTRNVFSQSEKSICSQEEQSDFITAISQRFLESLASKISATS